MLALELDYLCGVFADEKVKERWSGILHQFAWGELSHAEATMAALLAKLTPLSVKRPLPSGGEQQAAEQRRRRFELAPLPLMRPVRRAR